MMFTASTIRRSLESLFGLSVRFHEKPAPGANPKRHQGINEIYDPKDRIFIEFVEKKQPQQKANYIWPCQDPHALYYVDYNINLSSNIEILRGVFVPVNMTVTHLVTNEYQKHNRFANIIGIRAAFKANDFFVENDSIMKQFSVDDSMKIMTALNSANCKHFYADVRPTLQEYTYHYYSSTGKTIMDIEEFIEKAWIDFKNQYINFFREQKDIPKLLYFGQE